MEKHFNRRLPREKRITCQSAIGSGGSMLFSKDPLQNYKTFG